MRFNIESVRRSIMRNKIKSVLFFAIFAIITIILLVYLAGMENTKKELKGLSDLIPVYGQIVSLDGKRTNNLIIKKEKIDKLDEMDLLTDKVYTSRIALSKEEMQGHQLRAENSFLAIATNTLSVLSGLEETEIKWWQDEGEEILLETDLKCIVSESALESNGWKLGENIDLNQYYIYYDEKDIGFEKSIGKVSYQVVGVYKTAEAQIPAQEVQILLPYKAVEAVLGEKDAPFIIQSVQFRIRDPQQLDTVKVQFKEQGYLEIVPNALARKEGNTMIIEDSIYVGAATQLLNNLRIEKSLFWPFMIAAAAVVYFMTYLLMQNRSQEYHLVRIMGMKKRNAFFLYFCEYGVLMILGCIIGGILGSFLLPISIQTFFQVVGCVFLCFIIGMSLSLLRLGRMQLMTAISRND